MHQKQTKKGLSPQKNGRTLIIDQICPIAQMRTNNQPRALTQSSSVCVGAMLVLVAVVVLLQNLESGFVIRQF